MPAEPYSDEELRELGSYSNQADSVASLPFMRDGLRGVFRRFLATIAADRQRFEETIKGYTDDWANQKRKFEKRIAELEKIVKDQPDPMDYDALVFVNHTLEAEVKEWQDITKKRDKLIEGWNRDYKKAEAKSRAENQRLKDAINKALTNQIRAVAEAGSDIRDMAKDFIQTRDVKSLTNCGGDIYSLTNNAIKNLEQALHPQGEEPCEK